MTKRKTLINLDPVYHVIIDNCFGEHISKKIFQHILMHKNNFKPAKIRSGLINKKIRNNLSCFIDLLYISNDIRAMEPQLYWKEIKKIRSKSILLKYVDKFMESQFAYSLMASAPFPMCKFKSFNHWNTQISRYGNNEQYEWHIDRQNNDSRVVSLIYYCQKDPKKFEGGNLCLSGGSCYKGKIIGKKNFIEIEPKNDRMIIFNSRTAHKVNRTKSPKSFEDGRFSVNIWSGMKSTQLNDW